MDEDEELLQDFIIEASEILEQLGEQLVDLENRPQDNDLLNAVFRGFHTIKGGASFLALDAMVALCHRAEDVFNTLRNGERLVDSNVMDVILPVVDVLTDQFDAVRAGNAPEAAEESLLQKLEALSVPESQVDSVVAEEKGDTPPPEKEQEQKQETEIQSPAQGASTNDESSDEITDDEFESLLDSLEGNKKSDNSTPEASDPFADDPFASDPAPASDDISEEEFEVLLNGLEKKKKSEETQNASSPKSVKSSSSSNNKVVKKEKDEITEDEFDALLDELHVADKKPKKKPASDSQPAKKPVAKVQKQTVASSSNKPATSTKIDKEKSAKPKVNVRENVMPQAESTVRVDTKRLDDIMNMVGELVLVRNRMATLEAASASEEMSKVVANLDVVTADLQTAVMKTRMQPIKKVFGRFPRVVRDLARNLNKEVNLEMQGEDTDLDKNLVEALADPLVHLVRNAVDHGIETPDIRVANGKARAGTVVLTAEQEGDHILLTIEDDGHGMDPEVLRRAAVIKGLYDEESAARLDDRDCYNLIFAPGFSTKSEISDVSGRGVGMDVVKTRIVQLNGSVEVDSKLGKGSIIIIKVPLTLAIMPTLMVMLARQIFALPLASVNEIFHLDLTKTNIVDGQLVVMVRDRALPLFYLRRWLVNGCQNEALPNEGHVVVVSMGAQRIGFVVDTLIGQEEVVIKPLGALLHGMRGLAGATITGDGRISLILDIPGLMQRYAHKI